MSKTYKLQPLLCNGSHPAPRHFNFAIDFVIAFSSGWKQHEGEGPVRPVQAVQQQRPALPHRSQIQGAWPGNRGREQEQGLPPGAR